VRKTKVTVGELQQYINHLYSWSQWLAHNSPGPQLAISFDIRQFGHTLEAPVAPAVLEA
jgi:hypothetical protein